MKIVIPPKIRPCSGVMFDGLLSAAKGLDIAVAMLRSHSPFDGVTGQVQASLERVKSALAQAGATFEP